MNRSYDPCAMSAALEKAKEAVSGATGLARALSEETGEAITPQAVSQWRKVPPTRVIPVERVTGVSRTELRPDLYPSSEPKDAA